MRYSTTPYHKKIIKPWGHEVIFTPDGGDHVGKLLFVNAGKRLSLQYHDEKEETLCLVSGHAILWLENAEGTVEKIPMKVGEGYTIVRLQKHRIEAVDDAMFVECSDPEKGNTVRLEDDYHRGTETDAMRTQPQRGWTG